MFYKRIDCFLYYHEFNNISGRCQGKIDLWLLDSCLSFLRFLFIYAGEYRNAEKINTYSLMLKPHSGFLPEACGIDIAG